MSTMHETSDNANESKPSVVDAVFDAALAWIDVGLGHLKTSLVSTSRAMDRTAIALDTVREKLRS